MGVGGGVVAGWLVHGRSCGGALPAAGRRCCARAGGGGKQNER